MNEPRRKQRVSFVLPWNCIRGLIPLSNNQFTTAVSLTTRKLPQSGHLVPKPKNQSALRANLFPQARHA